MYALIFDGSISIALSYIFIESSNFSKLLRETPILLKSLTFIKI